MNPSPIILSQADIRRFWPHVARTKTCWVWQGTINDRGYGKFKAGAKSLAAHRISWVLTHGDIIGDLQVLHKCDNPPCVNPDHLFLGTYKDNQQDKAAKGRHWQQKKTHCPQGHAYTPENTFVPPSGGRKCVACRRIAAIAKRKKVRNAV